MNNTHTPSHWYIAHHNDIDGMKSIDIRHCCDIPHSTPQISQIARLPENAMANARLISAAPDLLSALEAAVARVQIANEEGDPILSAWLPDALSAIAKAKGAV